MYIRLNFRGRLSCTPGATQVPCDSGPRVVSHSWWIEGFLTMILLILLLILLLGVNLRLSVVLMMNVFFRFFSVRCRR